MWVGSISADQVYRIDPRTNSVTGVIAVGVGPRDLVVANGSLWVAEFGESTVSRLRVTS
jgi:YVTN family beta-propeller protein